MSTMDAQSEITVMTEIAKAIDRINDDPVAIARVLRWAADRYDLSLGKASVTGKRSGTVEEHSGGQFSDLAALYESANPKTEAERAMVVAYWFQRVKGQGEFDSQSVNTELKNLGYPAANITKTFTLLMKRSPKFVLQTRKSGTTKQARKRYKLTAEGIKKVEAMLRAEAEEEE